MFIKLFDLFLYVIEVKENNTDFSSNFNDSLFVSLYKKSITTKISNF